MHSPEMHPINVRCKLVEVISVDVPFLIKTGLWLQAIASMGIWNLYSDTSVKQSKNIFIFRSRQSTTSLQVVVGITNLTEAGTAYKATKLIKHSRYNKPYFANDIGLIKLNSSVQMSKLIQPIKFSPHEVLENSTLQLSKSAELHFNVFLFISSISAGWGRISAGGRLPKVLQKIALKSISHKTCSDIYNGSDVDIGHICTLTKAGEGACNVIVFELFLEHFEWANFIQIGWQRRSSHTRWKIGWHRELGSSMCKRKTRCICTSFILPWLAKDQNEWRIKWRFLFKLSFFHEENKQIYFKRISFAFSKLN